MVLGVHPRRDGPAQVTGGDPGGEVDQCGLVLRRGNPSERADLGVGEHAGGDDEVMLAASEHPGQGDQLLTERARGRVRGRA